MLSAKMPLFIAAVVGLSFLLLLIAFRSGVVALTAAVMNLFAAGASFGVVVAIFQWGWGSEALGVGKGGPIDAWAPVMFPRGRSTGWKKIFAPSSRSRSSRSASGVRGIGK